MAERQNLTHFSFQASDSISNVTVIIWYQHNRTTQFMVFLVLFNDSSRMHGHKFPYNDRRILFLFQKKTSDRSQDYFKTFPYHQIDKKTHTFAFCSQEFIN